MIAVEGEVGSSLLVDHLRLVEVTGNLPPQADKLTVEPVDILDAEVGFLVFVMGNRFVVDVDYQVVSLEGLCIVFV